MDANQQKFWLMSDEHHWQPLETPSGVEYDADRRCLKLAQRRREISFNDNKSLAEERLELTPQTLDQYGNQAFIDSETNRIVANAVTGSGVVIYDPEDANAKITDMLMGHDDVLYIVIDCNIIMHDRRQRWSQQNVIVPAVGGFSAWRIAAHVDGGVWVLDREHKKIGRVSGMPLHGLAMRRPIPDTAALCAQNPHPPTLNVFNSLNLSSDVTPVALASNHSGQLALLSWRTDSDAVVHLFNKQGVSEQEELSDGFTLMGSANPYSIAWVDQQKLALLLAGVNQESPVYKIEPQQSGNFPMGELYPLKKDFSFGPFVHQINYPPSYPTVESCRSLHRLSYPFYCTQGQAVNHISQGVLDSRSGNHHWHRLFIEAEIPVGCGIKIWLATSDQPISHEDILPEHWYEHRFGSIFQTTTRADIPVAAWESFPSELPHHKGLMSCDIEKNHSGLFSVLIQRATRKVRNMTGRYLHVQVELTGQGRNTPEIYALRAYGSRFSYIDRYLPELYQEKLYPPDAHQTGDATAHDFMGRMVTNFEGVLTQIEDRVADSYLLTDAATVPADSLPWLASWIGFDLNTSLPTAVQRHFLHYASELSRWHGSLRGLKLALEIATQGGVSGGEIVVLEDFRLRRTFASIVGADLTSIDDPLTTGVSISGNSFVGDTLFIGDEHHKEFLALFSADLIVDTDEQNAISQLFDSLAHRVTLLVHQQIDPQDLGLINLIATQETPAHVALRILPASHPFLVGMASLVGVDSYLAQKIPPMNAKVGAGTRLGKNHFIKGPAALDQRLQDYGSGTPDSHPFRPQAFAPDVNVGFGQDVTLDGSESRAFAGRVLTEFNWEYHNRGKNND